MARRSISEGADLILACGGDGTINEVLNGMVHSPVPLGVLPGGTANVLAVEVGIGTRMLRAADRFSTYVPARIALGLLQFPGGEPRHFGMMAGVGLDAMVVYNISAALKSRLGKVAYWIAGFSQVGKRLPEFGVSTCGRNFQASFLLASRVRNYGGDLTICRNASLLGPDFEVVIFEGPRALPYLKYFAAVLFGRIDRVKGATVLRATDLELTGSADPRVYIQIDGEHVGRTPARLSIVPDALTLLIPPEFQKKYG
jgi:diacylglycerol kinase (ATP)